MGRYIEVEKNVRLYVEDIGSGTPVIFLHGWPLSSQMFEYQFTLLSEQGYRCIGIDQRGFGKSHAPATGYDYDRLADDVKAVVDYLKLDQAYLSVIWRAMAAMVSVSLRCLARLHRHSRSGMIFRMA
jgi:non-heme chloroperoxidase